MLDRRKFRVSRNPSRFPWSACLAIVAIVAPAAGAGAIPAAPAGKSYFFATPGACHASGAFSRRECEMAFANAFAELRDRAPKFKSIVECRLRFALCESRRDGSGFSPVGLGVEIVVSSRGPQVAPAMAVEAPGSLFPMVPVLREYAARQSSPRDADLEDSNILPADRFEPFSKSPRLRAQFSFYNASTEGGDDIRPPAETPEQRRARLRAAPFVQ